MNLKHQSKKLTYLGIALVIYGLAGLIFELANTTYSVLSGIVWMILNPLFVLSVGFVRFPLMSFFAELSPPQVAIATMMYWGFPLIMISLGLILAYPSKK